MKKSKFMQSSKDMLSRSFNPSKCKTSLRLAGSRLKLLRNKKEVQVKQMRREIAQLLESGQDQTARIRVEHVVREEKTMAAYDLIQIYCELIVARLPIIESQKNCPIDLKEAIASIIFASPRCGDVPELVDVKKQFTSKYGKDFTTAAIEVRPACGVSRMLVEKLSAAAPDGPTKVKILTGIAEEHNVVWDYKSFDEKDPPNDMLSGPSTFGGDSQPYVQPSRYAYQDVQAPSDNTMHGSQLNSSYQDTKLPTITDNHVPAQDLSSSMNFQDKERPPDRRQNWPMEFKDATSAAMAAAESAERASMAAKAAAEFANGGKITRQHSTDSRKSETYVSKYDEPESYLSTKKSTDRISEKRVDRPYSDRTRLQKEQNDSFNTNHIKSNENFEEYGRRGKTLYSQSASLKSKASVDEDFLDKGVPAVERFSGKKSFKEDPRGEISSNKEPFKPDLEGRNEWPEKGENIRDVHIRKQPSVKSYRSGSSISDELNVFANTERPIYGYDTDNDYAVKGDILEEDLLASVRFDKFDSDGDDDHYGFDTGPRYDEPNQKSTRQPSLNRDSWEVGSDSSKTAKSSSSPFFAENLKSVNESEQDNYKPATFDDSDVSDIEEEVSMPTQIGIRTYSEQLKDEYTSPIKEKIYSGHQKKHLSESSDDESMYIGKSQGNKSYAGSPKKFSLKDSYGDLVERNDYSEDSDSASGEGLKLGKLRGGLRHTGYNHPHYLNNQLGRSSSPKEEMTSNATRHTVHSSVESPKIVGRSLSPKEEITSNATRPTVHSSVESPKIVGHRNRIPPQATEFDSDSDISEQEVSLPKNSIRKPNVQERRSGIEIKPKLSVGSSHSVFGSEDSDLDDEKERISKKNYSRAGISRRTPKASPNSPIAGTYSKTHLGSEALNSNGEIRRKPRNSYISEEFDSQNKQENEKPSSAKLGSRPARSNYWGPPEQSYSPKTTVTNLESTRQVSHDERDSEDIAKRRSKHYSLGTEQESTSKMNNSTLSSGKTTATKESLNTESPNAPSNKTSSSKDDGPKRAGHVHPKLPDYDFLVQSLQKRS